MMTDENECHTLTRVGPGTRMGELMRQYWLPAAKSPEVVADGAPLRLMLLGEKLIAELRNVSKFYFRQRKAVDFIVSRIIKRLRTLRVLSIQNESFPCKIHQAYLT